MEAEADHRRERRREVEGDGTDDRHDHQWLRDFRMAAHIGEPFPQLALRVRDYRPGDEFARARLALFKIDPFQFLAKPAYEVSRASFLGEDAFDLCAFDTACRLELRSRLVGLEACRFETEGDQC